MHAGMITPWGDWHIRMQQNELMAVESRYPGKRPEEWVAPAAATCSTNDVRRAFATRFTRGIGGIRSAALCSNRAVNIPNRRNHKVVALRLGE